MNREQQDIELIEGYLHQNLSEEEMRMFHEKRIMDDEFAELFYDMEVMTEGIKRSAAQTSLEEKLERLQKIMNESEEQYASEDAEIRIEGKTRQISYFKKYSYAVAASLALMVLAAIALLNINRLPTNEKLFAQYFVPFDNSGPTTKRGDSA